MIFVVVILFLVIIDIRKKTDLKSQIVSVGVLGTFVGIFIGLQEFNPANMKDSINHILIGLKTAFFTSIVGMLSATLLAVFQRLSETNIDDEKNEEHILLEISQKLNQLEKLDNSNNTDKIVGELERIRTVQTDVRNETENISKAIFELKENSNKENQQLIEILDSNFAQMNKSLEVAIDKLSKGATEEIINALKKVIEEFNQELQTQFGENFIKLNESVINLLQWQENYKSHIEELENHLQISTASIEKSKESLETISSKNNEVINVYENLQQILNTYDKQVEELNRHLQSYAALTEKAENIFPFISSNIDTIKNGFGEVTKEVLSSNAKQIESSQNMTKAMTEDIKLKVRQIKENFDDLNKSFDKNKQELELVAKHFKSLGEQIPQALQVSLEELNRGLTSLTRQFRKDYKEVIDKFQGLNK